MAININSKGEMTLTTSQTANLIHLFTQLVCDDNDFSELINLFLAHVVKKSVFN